MILTGQAAHLFRQVIILMWCDARTQHRCVYLLSHGSLILRQRLFTHDLMWPLSVVCFASLRAKGADFFHLRGSVFHYIPGRSIAHDALPVAPCTLAAGTARIMLKALRFPAIVENVMNVAGTARIML